MHSYTTLKFVYDIDSRLIKFKPFSLNAERYFIPLFINLSVRAEAQRLKAEDGVDILIALGHSGYDLDQKLAEEVEEIDVVVGGHSHTFLWTGNLE